MLAIIADPANHYHSLAPPTSNGILFDPQSLSLDQQATPCNFSSYWASPAVRRPLPPARPLRHPSCYAGRPGILFPLRLPPRREYAGGRRLGQGLGTAGRLLRRHQRLGARGMDGGAESLVPGLRTGAVDAWPLCRRPTPRSANVWTKLE